jgi:hypothetical protein
MKNGKRIWQQASHVTSAADGTRTLAWSETPTTRELIENSNAQRAPPESDFICLPAYFNQPEVPVCCLCERCDPTLLIECCRVVP